MMDTMYEAPDREGVNKCIVTKAAVEGTEAPKLVYDPEVVFLPEEKPEPEVPMEVVDA